MIDAATQAKQSVKNAAVKVKDVSCDAAQRAA